MKGKVKIGLVCLLRKTFDYESAWKEFKSKEAELKKIENVDWVIIDEPVIEVEEAKKAADKLSSELVDGVIITSGTFHLGHLTLIIEEKLKKPVHLWGLPEAPYDGGKIRYNSACGVHLNKSNLFKAGVKFVHHVVAPLPDVNWIDALRMVKAMEIAKIALVGSRAQGFFNLAFDELTSFKSTGAMLEYYQIADMYNQEVSDEEAKKYLDEIKGFFNCDDVNEEQIKRVAKLCVSIKKFVDSNHIDALAVRCWPEYAQSYGIAPCAAMSIIAKEKYLLACEGDAMLALSMLACKALDIETPYSADFSQVDFEEDTALLWHCGVAPCNLTNKKCTPTLDTYFAGGKGVTTGFVLKEGDFNIVRIDSALGKTRIFAEKGKAVYMDKLLKGTYAKGKFDKGVKAVYDTLLDNGFAHHVVMVYGDYIEKFRLLCKIKGWEWIEA